MSLKNNYLIVNIGWEQPVFNKQAKKSIIKYVR